MTGKKAILKYGITASAAGLLAQTTLELHGFGDMPADAERYRLLADAFTIPGVCLIMAWLLVLVSAAGIFDGIGYALYSTVMTLFPGMAGRKAEAYAGYLERKRESRMRPEEGAFLWHVGAVFMVPAVVFTSVFCVIYG